MIHLSSLFIVHIRSLVVGTLLIGGMVSFGILYLLLATPYIPHEGVPLEGKNLSVARDILQDVSVWVQDRTKGAQLVPTISNSTFFIPSSPL